MKDTGRTYSQFDQSDFAVGAENTDIIPEIDLTKNQDSVNLKNRGDFNKGGVKND